MTVPSAQAAASLDEIYEPIADRLAASEAFLVRLIRKASGAGGEVTASALAVARGGKRVRPALFHAAFLAAGGNGAATAHADRFAALVEAIHLSSLLHDDVLDEAELRRGVPTVNGLHGDQVAILAGDLLYANVFMEFLTDLPLEVVRILSNGARRMIEGEIRQTLQTGTIPTEAEYLDTIRAKTAAFFAATVEGAAAAAGVTPDRRAPYRAYGEAFGMAFQLIDDLLDWTGEEEAVGKAVHADLAGGKATLPLILCLANSEDRPRLKAALREAGAPNSGHAAARLARAVAESGALERTRAAACAEAEAARAALSEVPDGEGRTILANLLDFLLSRDR